MLLRFASHFLEERCEWSGCWQFDAINPNYYNGMVSRIKRI